MKNNQYIFIDEGGNFDFSPTGTKYFTLTSLTTTRPFQFEAELSNLRFDLIDEGLNIEYFHASEDRQQVRNKVFSIVHSSDSSLRFDSIIIEKRKTNPDYQEITKFYSVMLGYLLKCVMRGLSFNGFKGEIIVITDKIPVKRKRDAFEKTVKTTLSRMLPEQVPYKIFHHDSKSCYGLQVADYVNWAIFRKWRDSDTRSYGVVKHLVKSEFDIFGKGKKAWY